MKGMIAMAAALCALSACDRSEPNPDPNPEPTYASARAADEAIPDSLRAEYQHMLECETKAMAAKGREPEIDTATVVRLTKAVKTGQRAPAGC